jgi:hypothetical protein
MSPYDPKRPRSYKTTFTITRGLDTVFGNVALSQSPNQLPETGWPETN